MWDLIVSVPDHCLSFYFTLQQPHPTFCCGSYTHRTCSVRVKELYSSMNQNSEHITQDLSFKTQTLFAKNLRSHKGGI